MRTLSFASSAARQTYGQQVDALFGLPQKGRNIGAGIHVVPPASPPGPGWTDTYRLTSGTTYPIDSDIEVALRTRESTPAVRSAVVGPIHAQLGTKMREVSVHDEGALGDGSNDDTDAILSAISKAGTSGKVTFAGANTAYSVRCGVLDFGSRRVGGSFSHPLTNTRLIARDSGPWVVKAQGMSDIRGLFIDCNNLAQTGLLADVAHGSHLERIHVTKHLGYGIDLQRTTAAFHDLRSFNGARGIRVQGCNGSTLYDCFASDNQGRGWLITKAAVEGGECALIRCWADRNNLGATDPEVVLMDAVDGCAWHGGYIEGGEGGAGDFVITGTSHNVLLTGLHFIGPYLRLLGNCRAITVVGCRAPEITGTEPHMFVTANGGVMPRDVTVVGCFQTSSANSQPWIVRFTDGGTSWDGVSLDGWQSSVAPTVGWWRRGQRVWNDTPLSGEPLGWIQQASPGGQPGTWLPMGQL